MPLPIPEKDEKQKDFMFRCLTNTAMVAEYPDREQRIAVCYTHWKQYDNKRHTIKVNPYRPQRKPTNRYEEAK